MYMGFMKIGLSFMLAFIAMIMIVGITGISELTALMIPLYLYSFFHANNISGLDDERFGALEDTYLFGLDSLGKDSFRWNQKRRKTVAAVLIVLGVYMLWNVAFEMIRGFLGLDNPMVRAMYYFMKGEVPRIALGIAIIWFGIVLLKGKKVVPKIQEEPAAVQIEQKD